MSGLQQGAEITRMPYSRCKDEKYGLERAQGAYVPTQAGRQVFHARAMLERLLGPVALCDVPRCPRMQHLPAAERLIK